MFYVDFYCGNGIIKWWWWWWCLLLNEQIRADEYSEVVRQLTSGPRFFCHLCCYNMPLVCLTFAALLCISLVAVPAILHRWSSWVSATEGAVSVTLTLQSSSKLATTRTTYGGGIEFVHAIVVWLCLLTVYLISMHLSRRMVSKLTTSFCIIQGIGHDSAD